MYIFKSVSDVQDYLAKERKKGLKVGFVPTMGALHRGHLSLIQRSKQDTDLTVCSIFVNPTQFNEPKDLEKYPRTAGSDTYLLNGINTEVLFMPPVEEVYPPGLDTCLSLDFAGLDQVLEGEFRPGHFEGMAQVVKRLLDIIQPDMLFMGQKDFQQLAIVQSMLQQLGSDIDLVMCPIVREEDNLAMSSRNRRLAPALRPQAAIIHHTLGEVRQRMSRQSPAEIEAWALNEFKIPDFKAEYFKIIDGKSLLPVENFDDSPFIVACAAVWVGAIRLIDNIILKSEF